MLERFVSSSRKTNISVSGEFGLDLPRGISVHLSDFCCYTNFCCSFTFDKGKRHELLHHPDNRYGSCRSICPNSLLLTLTQQCHLWFSVTLTSHFSVPHTSIFMVSHTYLCMFFSCSICASRSHSSTCEDQAVCWHTPLWSERTV